MIPYVTLNKIVQETNIVEVIGEYVQYKKKGNSNFCVCPFHDDNNPSMSVSNKVKRFTCFSCGARGNVIDFVSRYENISIDQAATKLAKRIGLNLNLAVDAKAEKDERLFKIMTEVSSFYQFYLKNSEEGINALKYLHERGISDEIIEKFNIGLSPSLNDALYQFLIKKGYLELDLIDLGLVRVDDNKKGYDMFRNRIMFPIANEYGGIVGFSGRIYYQSQQSKYMNSNENVIFHKGEILYNLHNATNVAKRKDRIYIFEGFMDVIAAYRASIENGVCVMGTALTTNHIAKLLKITKNIVLCFDGDDAGIHAMEKAASLFADFGIIPDSIVLPNNLDPDEYIKEYGKDQLSTYLISKSKPVYSWLYNLAYSKVLKSDIKSVETFKKSMFDILGKSKQSTIIDFYLNQMASDLGVSIESLRSDAQKQFKLSINSQQNNAAKQTNTIVSNAKSAKKINTKGVKLAYEKIIKHSLVNAKLILEYKAVLDKIVFTEELTDQYSIMLELTLLIDLYPELVDNDEPTDFIIKNIQLNDACKSYLNDIIKNTIIQDQTQYLVEFEQCIDKIKKYSNSYKANKIRNDILEEGVIDSSRYDDYMNSDYIKLKKDN